MPDRSTRLVPNAKGIRELETDLAFGLYAVALMAETEAKREAPVRGGYRSFRPGTSPIGGTLRRSIHAVGFDQGGGKVGEDNESGRPLPSGYAAAPGSMTAFVGTNSGYGSFVELGTVRMLPRPFLLPALESSMANATATIRSAIARRGRPFGKA